MNVPLLCCRIALLKKSLSKLILQTSVILLDKIGFHHTLTNTHFKWERVGLHKKQTNKRKH